MTPAGSKLLTLHMSSNLILTSISETEAIGVNYYVVYTNQEPQGSNDTRPGDGIPGHRIQKSTHQRHGQVRVRFVKIESLWKLAHLEIVFIFDSSGGNKMAEDTYAKLTGSEDRTAK